MLIVGINKVSAGVVCEYGEFTVYISYTDHSEAYISKEGTKSSLELITNYFSANPNYSDDTYAQKVNNGDIALCTSKAYITKFKSGKYDYMITGSNPETWSDDTKSSFPSFVQTYERQLTNAYCLDCEINCPAKNDMSYGFVFDGGGRIVATVTNGTRHNVSEYTRYKSTEAGFIVEDVSACPTHKSDFTVIDLKENGAVVRNHQTYAFTKSHYDVVEDKYVNYENNGTKSCGTVTKIPSIFPSLVSTIYTIIQIAVPIVLVLLGMFDLIKAITAQKDDDIKKAQGLFFKRLISALLVFFVFTAVKLVMSFATKDSGNLVKCMDCFIRNNCK